MFNKRLTLEISLIIAGTFWAINVNSQIESPVSGPGYAPPSVDFSPAGSGLGTGKLKFFPELEAGIMYDDNIFLDESEEASDEIAHVFPKLMIDYSLQERGNISVSYAGNFAFYSQFSDNNWQRNNFGLVIDYLAPSGLNFNLIESFVLTSDPFGSRDEYGLGLQKERSFNLLGSSLGYVYEDKLRIAGYFNYNVQEYENMEVDYSQNFDEQQYGIGLEKRLTGKTWGFIRYFRVYRDFNTASPDGSENETNDADYTSDRLFAGLTWDITSRITGELNLGYENRKAENPVDPAGNPYKDENTWLAVTNINYSLNPGVTDLGLRFDRGVYQRGSNTNELFVATDFGVAVEHRFYSFYKLNLYLELGNNDYNTPRSDDNYRGGIELQYLLHSRYAVAGVYDFYRRNSNITGQSFTENRFMLTLTMRY